MLQNSNTQGRLSAVQSGTALYPDTLQDLTYSYDPMGNVTGIADDLAGPQLQTFTYDSVYRLTQGYTTGGTGGFYDESYTYDATTGNLSSKAGVNYGYQDSDHFHAVTHLDGVQKYWYDANENMTDRIVGSDSYELTYYADNRLVEVEKNQTVVGEYTYDGDGNRIKSVVNGVTTYYIGSYYKWRVETSGSTGAEYYYAGSQRVAMRVGRNNYLNIIWIRYNAISEIGLIPAFGGPFGFIPLALDIESLTTWDTIYYVDYDYWGPSSAGPNSPMIIRNRMKLTRLFNYPDLFGIILLLWMTIPTILGWSEGGRRLIEFAVFFLIGGILGMLVYLIEIYNRKRVIGEKHGNEQLRINIYFSLFIIMGIISNYVPAFVKYWIFSVIEGFVGIFVSMLIIKEVRSKKRYSWNEIKPKSNDR